LKRRLQKEEPWLNKKKKKQQLQEETCTMTEVPFSSVAPESRRVDRRNPNDRREEVLPEGKDKTTRNVHDKKGTRFFEKSTPSTREKRREES
jgi:hypothetical protein